MTNNIIKLKGYKEITCFKYINQVFFCALFFCFICFTQLLFIFGVSLLKLKNNNVILPNWLNFDAVKYPNAPTIIFCSGPTSLRKHAYSNILKILPPKNENFQRNIFDIFHISAQNIDCGYSLEPPHRDGSNEYPQSMFWAEIRTRGPRAMVRSPEWHSHCRHADVMQHFSNPIMATNENIKFAGNWLSVFWRIMILYM